jgi:hypothetical protein
VAAAASVSSSLVAFPSPKAMATSTALLLRLSDINARTVFAQCPFAEVSSRKDSGFILANNHKIQSPRSQVFKNSSSVKSFAKLTPSLQAALFFKKFSKVFFIVFSPFF